MKSSLLFAVIFVCSLELPAAAELNPLLEASTRYQSIEVTGMVSVDTLVLADGKKVRLIGVRGPGRPKIMAERRDEHGFIIEDHSDPTTPVEEEAARYVRDQVQNKKVRLEFDAERRDDDGVLLVYVYLPDGTMLNEELLRRGYARLKLRSPTVKYDARFRAAYQESRREMRGMQRNW